VLYTIFVFVGATIPLLLVWDIADALNALMILPNLIAILLLSGVIAAETKKYGNAEHIEDVDTDPVPLLEEFRKTRGK
jgi:AGCS family alanine or glycine:cation symporter